MSNRSKQKKSVSLRTINIWLIVGAIVISGLGIYSTYNLFAGFRHLTRTAEQQIELRKAVRELMDASDYLTEKVQRFTVHGEISFLEDYFEEAFEARHREDAIAKMSKGYGNTVALENLKSAMEQSLSLMNREYYAMRLVIEAKGYTEYPELLDSVALSDEDRALSPAEKMSRATEMVLDEAYYTQKNLIRVHMRNSLDELEKKAYSEDAADLTAFRKDLIFVRVVVALQAIGILLMVWLTARLGIHPILNAVERIKENSRIPEVGANEFRYLARAYNRMYEVYKNSLERLNYQASHDALTGAYNRSGYELILSAVDLNSTYMILFDVDDFKDINDTYGHEAGDKVLVKLVRVLEGHFRADDYICRIGGDEFVVFMVHSTQMQKRQITAKLDAINREMENTDDGVPRVSISVGIVHGTQAKSADDLFKITDRTMYRSKRRGKHTYTFHADDHKAE